MRSLHTLPKAHLHLHLEGTARPATIAEFAAEQGKSFSLPERWDSFAQFNDAYAAAVACITRPDQLARICREIVEDDAASGVQYIEPIFLPHAYADRFGMSVDEVFALVRNAFAAAGAELGVELGYQIAGIWHFDLDFSESTAEFAANHTDQGVVAYNFCGIEPADCAPWQRAADIAREAGLGIIPHAGEFGPAGNVQRAIEVMAPDRVCHGVRAIEDERVLDLLADRQMTCDIAATSNHALNVFTAFELVPVRTFLDHQIPFTLGTDDALFFGSTVQEEYEKVRTTFCLADSEVAEIARTSVNASFATAATKARLNSAIDQWLAS